MLYDGYVVYRAVGDGSLEYLADDKDVRWTRKQDEAAVYDSKSTADMDAQENKGTVAQVDVRDVARSVASIRSAGHTPGPWRYEHEHSCGDKNGHLIRTFHHKSANWSGTLIAEMNCTNRKALSAPESMQADARLIAAAPDLLEMLEKLMHETDRGTNLCARHIADEADALIVKVKGGA